MAKVPPDTVLRTERLRLRAVSLGDVEVCWSATRVAGFNDGMVWDPPESREELVSNVRDCVRDWEEGRSFAFTVELRTPAAAVGRLGLGREGDDGTWTLGFWIHPDHQGNGYATEAARAAIEFGFETLGAERITCAHAVWNTRSERVVRKLAFRFVRENPCGFEKRGQPVAEYEYVLERADRSRPGTD